MENEHSELIIGYFARTVCKVGLWTIFYAWVNESADNKKLFFRDQSTL